MKNELFEDDDDDEEAYMAMYNDDFDIDEKDSDTEKLTKEKDNKKE